MVCLSAHTVHSLGSQITQQPLLPRQENFGWFTPNSASRANVSHTPGAANAARPHGGTHPHARTGAAVAWTQLLSSDHHSPASWAVTIMCLQCQFPFLGCLRWRSWAVASRVINCCLHFPMWRPYSGGLFRFLFLCCCRFHCFTISSDYDFYLFYSLSWQNPYQIIWSRSWDTWVPGLSTSPKAKRLLPANQESPSQEGPEYLTASFLRMSTFPTPCFQKSNF